MGIEQAMGEQAGRWKVSGGGEVDEGMAGQGGQ